MNMDDLKSKTAEELAQRQKLLEGYGAAYAGLRNTIERLVARLGDDKFARSVVTIGAREALGKATSPAWRRGYASHLSFCEPFMASPDELMSASHILESAFALRDTPVELEGLLGSGRLVVRGKALYYETDNAAAVFAHYFEPYGGHDRWTAAMTTEAEIYLAEHRMPRPAVSVANTKTEAAAKKALVRMALQHFHVKLDAKVQFVESVR